MDFAQILVYILAVVLALFLVLAIVLIVMLIRITMQIKDITSSAQRTVSNVEKVMNTVGSAATPLGIMSFLMKNVKKKAGKKRRSNSDK